MLRSAIGFLLLAVTVYWLYRRLCFFGVFKENLTHHAPGKCRYPLGDLGTGNEDVSILPGGIALISTGFGTRGAIRLIDLNNKEERFEDLQIVGPWDLTPEEFQPHGISAWTNPKTGENTLAVVNHPRGVERIEIFRVDVKGRKLNFIKSISLTYSGMLNDVVLLDDQRFYVTMFCRSRITALLEWLLSLPTSRVFYFDGREFHVAATGLFSANGVNISPDRRHVYVGETGGNSMAVLQPRSDGSLELFDRHNLGSAPDNLEVDPSNGDVWVGTVPLAYTMLQKFALKLPCHVPSQVLRLKMKDGHVTDMTEVFYDTGSRLNGSTVASRYKDKILIGTVLYQLLVCDVTYLE